MNTSQTYNKQLKETNKFYWFTLGIISVLVLGINIYLVVRKPPNIIQQAQKYLAPLPDKVNLDLLQDLQLLQKNTPLSPTDFYKIVLKYSVSNSGDTNAQKQ